MQKNKFQGISIKVYLVIILLIIISLQGIVLIATLIARDFYTKIDEQSIDSFVTRSNQQVEAVNEKISEIVKGVVESSSEITSIYTVQTALKDTKLSSASLSAIEYQNAHVLTSKVLLNLLDRCNIDTAFYIINDNNTDDVVAVEIKNVYRDLEGNGYAAYQIAIGSSSISKEYGLGIHKNWDIEIDAKELTKPYFTKPVDAIKQDPYGYIEQYGYWYFGQFDDLSDQTTYTLPLIDESGQYYGIIGVGISDEYFAEYYINPNHYNFSDNFYAIASVEDSEIKFNEQLPNTKQYEEMATNSSMQITPKTNGDFYSLTINDEENDNNRQEYVVKLDKLSMYSSNSAFAEQGLMYLTIVDSSKLYQNSEEIKNIFFIAFTISAVFGMLASSIISKMSTIKIEGLSQSVKQMAVTDNLEFIQTGFTEIDNLTSAIQFLNERVAKTSRTLNHLFELTELNLGGYEYQTKERSIQITEYIGKLLKISAQNPLTVDEWYVHYNKLTKNVIDKDKNIYLYWYEDSKYYLKVTQTLSEEGFIGMVLDVTKEIEEVMDAKYKLDYDALTKLYSRTAYYTYAQKLIDEDKSKVGAVIFIDLDNLKFVNDTFGHDYGDLYLIEGSKIFSKLAQNRGIAARMSGDEFAVYLHGFDSQDEIRDIVNKHLESSKNVSIDLPDGTVQRVRFSSGIAWYNTDTSDINELVKYADFAMYDAKHTMKGTLREFNRKVYDEKIYMMENTEAINQLIEEQLVDFMFQPIVSLKTGEIYAFEALMRSKLEAFKSPLEILKVATAQFKLRELEHMIVSKAINCAYEKRDQIKDCKIYINSITSQMMPIELFETLKEKYGDFLKQIVIEITEAEDNTPEKMRQKVSAIKKYGMDIAIDDFGSGYSNELRIIAINPDIVKLDIELIQGIHEDGDKQALCENIINYSHSKNIQIVAEGVETKEDLQKIIDIGADYVQGYYIIKPSFEIQEVPQVAKEEILSLNQFI